MKFSPSLLALLLLSTAAYPQVQKNFIPTAPQAGRLSGAGPGFVQQDTNGEAFIAATMPIPGTAGNGTTDDSAALQAYMNSLPATGGIIYLQRGAKYLLSSSITIPPNVIIDCQQASGSGTNSYTLGTLGGLRLAAAATITPSSGSRIQHCPILRNLTWPQLDATNYAGTAITYPPFGGGVDTLDTYVVDSLIVGFNTCIDGSGTMDRFHWLGVECDGVNGYVIGSSFDSSELNIRNWPWGSVTNNSITRTGIGLSILGNARIDDIKGRFVDFGHAIGLQIANGGGTCCNGYFPEVWLDNNATHALVLNAPGITFGKISIFGSLGVPITTTTGAYVDHIKIDAAPVGNCWSGSFGIVTNFTEITGCTDNFTSARSAWTVGAPAIACQAGTLDSSTNDARYNLVGKTVYYNVKVTLTGIGTCSGFVTIQLPATAKSDSLFGGRETALTGKALTGQILAGGTTMTVDYYDNSAPAAANAVFVLSGVFEAQ